MPKKTTRRILHLAIFAAMLLGVMFGAYNGKYDPTALAQTYQGGGSTYVCLNPPAGCTAMGCTTKYTPSGTVWVCTGFGTTCRDRECVKRDW